MEKKTEKVETKLAATANKTRFERFMGKKPKFDLKRVVSLATPRDAKQRLKDKLAKLGAEIYIEDTRDNHKESPGCYFQRVVVKVKTKKGILIARGGETSDDNIETMKKVTPLAVHINAKEKKIVIELDILFHGDLHVIQQLTIRNENKYHFETIKRIFSDGKVAF